MEGAVIDSFCLDNVQDLHPELNEIWISRIVDHAQVQAPRHLLDALNNLIMLYAGTTSLNDVQHFVDRHHQEELLYALNETQQGRHDHQPHWIEVIELPVWSGAQYYWTHENFDACIQASELACMQTLRDYDTRISRNRQGQALRMVARRRGDHATGAFFVAQLGQLVVGAANLEREHRLQVFALEPDVVAQPLGELASVLQRGFYGNVINARGEDLLDVLFEHRKASLAIGRDQRV